MSIAGAAGRSTRADLVRLAGRVSLGTDPRHNAAAPFDAEALLAALAQPARPLDGQSADASTPDAVEDR